MPSTHARSQHGVVTLEQLPVAWVQPPDGRAHRRRHRRAASGSHRACMRSPASRRRGCGSTRPRNSACRDAAICRPRRRRRCTVSRDSAVVAARAAWSATPRTTGPRWQPSIAHDSAARPRSTASRHDVRANAVRHVCRRWLSTVGSTRATACCSRAACPSMNCRSVGRCTSRLDARHRPAPCLWSTNAPPTGGLFQRATSRSCCTTRWPECRAVPPVDWQSPAPWATRGTAGRRVRPGLASDSRGRRSALACARAGLRPRPLARQPGGGARIAGDAFHASPSRPSTK